MASSGEIDDVRVWGKRTAAEIGQDMTTELIGNESGLEADYPLNEGQGQTAHDLTPNGNDGTLAGLNGGLPAWVVPGNAGIDLGDDGITANSTRSSTAGALQFQGSNYVSLPNGLIDGAEPSETLEAWFETTSGGVILGYQSSSARRYQSRTGWIPAIYVGTDGRLYGGSMTRISTRSTRSYRPALSTTADGTRSPWSIDGQSETDDRFTWMASSSGSVPGIASSSTRAASTRSGPDTRDVLAGHAEGWYGFVGQIDRCAGLERGAIGRPRSARTSLRRRPARRRGWRPTIPSTTDRVRRRLT